MTYWNRYTIMVKRNCTRKGEARDLAYWRDNLFAGTIIYLLPFCLIALLPGLYWIFFTGQYSIAVVDLLTVAGMVAVAFAPGMKIILRKFIFICSIYLFSCALTYFIGLPGPGLIYLLAACLFSILILPTSYKFWPAWLNTVICFLFGAAIFFNVIPPGQAHGHLLGEWIAISTNLIFLSFLSAALIPQLFNGLQETLDKEKKLQLELNRHQDSLQAALDLLQQKNGELEQFAYVASHDLKEPLRMVTSFMGLLKSKYGTQLDQKAHSYMDFAIDGGRRMQAMVADLLDLSRSARQHGNAEMVNLNDILHEVQQNILRLSEEHDAKIVVATPLPILTVHKTDMISLLQNLLSNAIKFRKKELNPVIHISAIERPTEWLFSIEDNGIGIDPEKCGKIFEVFTRLHAQSSYEGTGIGLAICRKIVAYNGGEIWVDSQPENGSTFYFTLKK